MRVAIVVGLLALGGCATGYQPQGFSGGFTELQLSENVFKVDFAGNGFTSPQRVEEMALLRSAELTLHKGFRYFALADSRVDRTTSAWTTPAEAQTNFSATSFGNTMHGSATTTYTGGDTYFVNKAAATNVVVMFRDKPDGAFAFDAAMLCQSIGAKYKVTC